MNKIQQRARLRLWRVSTQKLRFLFVHLRYLASVIVIVIAQLNGILFSIKVRTLLLSIMLSYRSTQILKFNEKYQLRELELLFC